MKIIFATSHGKYEISGNSTDSVEKILATAGIPFNSVSVYGCQDYSETGELITPLKTTAAELSSRYSKIIIRPDRNIDYEAVLLRRLAFSKTADAVTEYTFVTNDRQEITHKYFSQSECRDYITGSIEEFSRSLEIDKHRPVVVGVSGGGDSNALLAGLLSCGKFEKSQIIPVMMMGIPDWDLGLERAQSQCADLGLDLQIVDSDEVNTLLGRDSEDRDWVGDFESTYRDSDLEVIGTLAVRLALSAVARRHDAQAAVTGLNLEDILAECLLATLRGEPPLPFPTRRLDDVTFWYPMYRCPKKIIDGCNPKLSLQNYADRYPSYMYWRAAAYHLAQQIGCAQVGMEFQLLHGFQALSKKSLRKPIHKSELGFSIAADVSDQHLNKWKKFISGKRHGPLRSIA